MTKERITQKQRELASKMFNAEEARQRTKDLELEEDVLFQDTLLHIFDRIENVINTKKGYCETVHLSPLFPIERLSKIVGVLEELNYKVSTEELDESYYINIDW